MAVGIEVGGIVVVEELQPDKKREKKKIKEKALSLVTDKLS